MGACSAVSFGAQSAFAQVSPRPISLDAIAHEQGTVVLVRQPLDSVLIFLDAQDQLRWQRRLLPDEQLGVLLRGADSDRVCRARRQLSGGMMFGGMPSQASIEVECFRLADGEPLSVDRIFEGSNAGLLMGTAGNDGTRVLYSEINASSAGARELQQIRTLADGREFRQRILWGRARANERGGVLVVGSARPAIRFDPAGREAARSPFPTGFAPLSLAPSGSSLGLIYSQTLSVGSVQLALEGLSTGLESLWRRPIDVPFFELYGNALGGAPGAPALGGPLDWSLPAARGSQDGPWLLALGARRVVSLDPLSGEPGAVLTLPSSGSLPASQGWALVPAPGDEDVLLLRSDLQGLELRRFRPASGRVGPPLVLPRVPDANGFPTRFALAGDRLVLAPLVADGPIRLAKAPELAAEQPVTAVHSGLWFDPQATGQGLMLDVSAEQGRWFAGWFTFADLPFAGSEAPAEARRLSWYTALGRSTAGAPALPVEGPLFESRGGDFAGRSVPATQAVGGLALRAIDCNTLEFSYRLQVPGSEDVRVGARRLQRLGPAPFACGGSSLAQQSGLRSASTGSWVLEGRPSQGVLMQVDPGAAGATGSVRGAWFGFDAGQADDSLAQHWLTLSGRSVAGQPGVVELEWMRTLGGSFDAQPTRNTQVIGRGRLRFTACDRAVLEYSFDAPGLAGDAFAGLQGQVNLRRFEPCG